VSAMVLVVDDDAAVRRAVGGLLRDEGYRVEEAETAAKAHAALTGERAAFSAVVLDIRMPGETGLQLLARLPRPLPAPVIVLSGEASAGEAVEALRLGATDFVEKPPTAERLLTALRNALQLSELHAERERLVAALARPGSLVGESAAMRLLRETIAKVGPSDALVLIQGETGAGKERAARALHEASGRRGRLVAVNCAAIPSNLLESELFGHERGAFSGATARHLGRFEQAQGGTLLLDEIGDMPLELQSKLLRALQERTIERLGGHESIRIDVRVLAATNRDLEALMREGKFREDLYYRLNVVTLNLPPLRERRRDIPLLVEHFLAKYAGDLGDRGVAPDALDRLVGHDWPGNVRELENVVQRAMVMATSDVIMPEHLPIGPVSAAASVAVDASLEEIIERKLIECVRGLREHASANLYDLMIGLVEKPLLRAVLRETGGNQVRAAQILGINRNTLRKKLTEHGIDPDTLDG